VLLSISVANVFLWPFQSLGCHFGSVWRTNG
jgi:hypothetical protein